jgi:hypothetical protein
LRLEHRKAELQEDGPCDAPGDNPARFLRELGQLRAEAGLGHAELAARAHYPYDVIRAAEVGPSLPSLPVLSAYVRGCGGTPAEWEERWRSLTSSPALPLLPARPAGSSEAATAGARVGAAAAADDGHDPALIMAALDRVADGMAADMSSPSAAVTSSATARVSTGGAALHGADSPDPTLLGSAVADAVFTTGAGAWAVMADDAAPGTDSRATAAAAPAVTAAPNATTVPRLADTSAVSAASVSAASAASAASANSPAGGSRRPLPTRALIAALVVVLCLVVALLALLA